MRTVGEARFWLKEKLKNFYAEEELPDILFLTLNFITGLSQTQLHAFPEKELNDDQIPMLLLLAKKLQTGMPVQYALGETEFFGLRFEVNPFVLIPRPETEELVSWILEEKGGKVKGERWRGEGQKGESSEVRGEREMAERILDIGTGSGCISVAIKKNWLEAEVSGLDISTEALKTAQKNALSNEVEVIFFQQDILNFYPVKEALPYSIIVSNPPYITPNEQKLMHNNVLDFEPYQALFVPENDPLLFYRTIARHASFMLQKNGLLFFEINEKYGKQTLGLLQQNGFVELELRKDFRGKDRMVRGLKV